MKPSVGRIVLYWGMGANRGKTHPAIITAVLADDVVDLSVFPNRGSMAIKSGVQWGGDFGGERTEGWFWPPRVAE